MLKKIGILMAGGLLMSCGGGDDDGVLNFMYGNGQPGAALEDGGEILLERIKLNVGDGNVEYSTFHAYQFMPLATSAKRPPVNEGGCLWLGDGDGYPTNVIPPEAQYVDWGDSIALGAKDGSWSKTVPKIEPEAGEDGLLDNRPNFNRKHPFLYGGPKWQGDNLAADDFQNNATYSVSIPGKGDFDIVFPPAHTAPLSIGTSNDPVEVPRTGDWEVTWPSVAQELGEEHSRSHNFTFMAFAEVDATAMAPIALFICPAVERGKMTFSEADLARLPDAGIIQHGRLTHYMEDLDGSRFDLMAIDCTIGTYAKTSTAGS